MATTTVKIEGLQALGERFRKLALDMKTKTARSATNAAAQIIKKRTKSNITASPAVRTRSLLNSVIVKKLPASQTKLTSEHIVTFRGRGRKTKNAKGQQIVAPHARFVEFGTVNMPAEPTLRPAFESEKGAATQAMIDKLKSGIDKAGAG